MKFNRLLLIIVIGMLCMGATVTKIILFTDKPNSPPVTTDFMLFQRNNDYVNASVAQSLAVWFNNPQFTGNVVDTGGKYWGDGGGLSNIAAAVYLFKTNDIGNQETFVGPTVFTGNGNSVTLGSGTSLFGSVSGATNLQPTFLTFTADPLDPNTLRVLAGQNITFTVSGTTLTIAGSTTITNLLILGPVQEAPSPPAWGGPSNTVPIDGQFYFFTTTTPFSFTNMAAASGTNLWSTIVVSNQTANPVTGYCTIPGIRIYGVPAPGAASNAVIVPSGKTLMASFLSISTMLTNAAIAAQSN